MRATEKGTFVQSVLDIHKDSAFQGQVSNGGISRIYLVPLAEFGGKGER